MKCVSHIEQLKVLVYFTAVSQNKMMVFKLWLFWVTTQSSLKRWDGTAGQPTGSKVKLNCAKRASQLMPFINRNTGANWRVELRGGPLGCKREGARQRQGARGGKREGWSGREFSKGLTARPLQLLHYWSSAKREQGQGKACVKRNTHRGNYVSAHKWESGCIADLQPSGYDEVRIFFSPCYDFHLLLSVRQVSMQWLFVETRHTRPFSTRDHNERDRYFYPIYTNGTEFYEIIRKIFIVNRGVTRWILYQKSKWVFNFKYWNQ